MHPLLCAQVGARIERPDSNIGDTLKDRDAGQTAAGLECPVPDAGGHSPQRGAVVAPTPPARRRTIFQAAEHGAPPGLGLLLDGLPINMTSLRDGSDNASHDTVGTDSAPSREWRSKSRTRWNASLPVLLLVALVFQPAGLPQGRGSPSPRPTVSHEPHCANVALYTARGH